MPEKLKEWPGALEHKEYYKKVDAFFTPYFDQGMWEFSDQEIDDFRNRLHLRQPRTRATRTGWFCEVAQIAAQRAGFGLKVKVTPGGVAIQVMMQVPGR